LLKSIYSKLGSDFELCITPSAINPRSSFEIQEILRSHEWEAKSADKSPWGIISRFACTKCGDEFVAMLTTGRGMEKESSISILEVSADEIILS
jgi:hypothetical protein